MDAMTIYIYALFDPRAPGLFKYVGQSTDVKGRLNSHVKGRDEPTRDWIRDLAKAGFSPSVVVLETTNEVHASQREAHFIREHQATVLNVKRPDPNSFVFEVSPIITLPEMERRYIAWALDFFAGNKLSTARALGIGRQTLYNKLKAHSLA